MTDTQIDAFLAVVQFGSFTKAAESLFISEPALSRSILLLEKELGCTLIERKRGGRLQALTPAGKQFVQIADRWKILVTESKKLTGQRRRRPSAHRSSGILQQLCPSLRLQAMHGAKARTPSADRYAPYPGNL